MRRFVKTVAFALAMACGLAGCAVGKKPHYTCDERYCVVHLYEEGVPLNVEGTDVILFAVRDGIAFFAVGATEAHCSEGKRPVQSAGSAGSFEMGVTCVRVTENEVELRFDGTP